MLNSSSSCSAISGNVQRSLSYLLIKLFFSLAWIGMLSGVVIEKIQEANKVSAAYKAPDSNTEEKIEDQNRERTDSKAPELYVRL